MAALLGWKGGMRIQADGCLAARGTPPVAARFSLLWPDLAACNVVRLPFTPPVYANRRRSNAKTLMLYFVSSRYLGRGFNSRLPRSRFCRYPPAPFPAKGDSQVAIIKIDPPPGVPVLFTYNLGDRVTPGDAVHGKDAWPVSLDSHLVKNIRLLSGDDVRLHRFACALNMLPRSV